MKITMIGTGYVGLVTGACFADMGNHVYCVDVDRDKVKSLAQGIVPIYEPGLDQMVVENIKEGRLHFTTDTEMGIKHGEIIFIAVGTPEYEDGSADLIHVLGVAGQIGQYMPEDKIVVNKSTVPVGTNSKVASLIKTALKKRGVTLRVNVVSNPEFLKEGNAIEDFMKPDRIVIGSDDSEAIDKMRQLYGPFNRNHDVLIVMDPLSAELTKYAANVMLATKISLMNELANIAELTGADIEKVRLGIGSDPRIGYQFIYPGCGYGGSCFPKDVRALIFTSKEYGSDAPILEAVESRNEKQKESLFQKLQSAFDDSIKDRQISIWGTSFKPKTDDMREAPSRVLIDKLLANGDKVRAYDPVAKHEAMKIFGDNPNFEFIDNQYDTLEGSDALVVCTEWQAFRSPDFVRMGNLLKRRIIVDGRNLYSLSAMKQYSFNYHSIGRPSVISF